MCAFWGHSSHSRVPCHFRFFSGSVAPTENKGQCMAPQGLISSWTHLQQQQQQGIPMPRQDGTCC